MSIQEDYKRYRYHFERLGSRHSPSNERLSVLRYDTFELESLYCGFARILRWQTDEAMQAIPKEITNLQQAADQLCAAMTQVLALTPKDAYNLGDQAIENLEKIRNYRHMVKDSFAMAHTLRALDVDLPESLMPAEEWADYYQRTGRRFEACLDVLVEPDTLDLPDELIESYAFLERLWKCDSHHPDTLPLLLNAAKHPIPIIREYAASHLENQSYQQVIEILTELTRDKNVEVAAAAHRSLHRLSKD